MPIWHPHTLGQLVPHPTSGARLLASTLSSRCYTAETDGLCFKNLLYSSDFGETWRTLQEYVVMYDWARALKTHALEYPEDAISASKGDNCRILDLERWSKCSRAGYGTRVDARNITN